MRSVGIAVGIGLMSLGCYVAAQNLYGTNPELSAVRLAASGIRARHPEALGMVYASAEGSESCDELAAAALRKLLAEARALGGASVVEAQFRGRWGWVGRAVCRERFGTTGAWVRGFALR
jgi:hypothetical protein